MTVVSEHTWGPGAGCKGPRRRARPPRGSERTPKAVLLQSCTLAGAPHGDAERSSGKLRRLRAREFALAECGQIPSRFVLSNAP